MKETTAYENTTLYKISQKTEASTASFSVDTSFSTSNLSTLDVLSSTIPSFKKPKTTSSNSFTDSQIAATICISLLGLIFIALLTKGFCEWRKQCKFSLLEENNSDNNSISLDFAEINRPDADGNSGEAEQTELTWEIGRKYGQNFPTFSKAFYIEQKKNSDPTTPKVGLYDANDTTGMY